MFPIKNDIKSTNIMYTGSHESFLRCQHSTENSIKYSLRGQKLKMLIIPFVNFISYLKKEKQI